MGFFSRFIHRQKLVVFAEHVTMINLGEEPRPARYIQVCIPVSNLLFNHKHVIMANSFSKVQKAPFTLPFLDVNGVITTDKTTALAGTAGDGTVLQVIFDLDANQVPLPSGWLVGVNNGVVDAIFTALNSKGEQITGKVTITITDGVPVVNPAASIGVVVGDAVAQ